MVVQIDFIKRDKGRIFSEILCTIEIWSYCVNFSNVDSVNSVPALFHHGKGIL